MSTFSQAGTGKVEQRESNASLWQALVATKPGWGQFALRLGLAVMLWPHGAQKTLGWFGGYGFSGTYDAMSQTLPSPIVFLVILIEFLAPVLLLFGYLTRLAAVGVAAVMIGAVLTVHLPNGFFMNWLGTQTGEGFEFHLLALSIAVALFIQGSGSLSADLRLSKKS